jgi:hypothetical protein
MFNLNDIPKSLLTWLIVLTRQFALILTGFDIRINPNVHIHLFLIILLSEHFSYTTFDIH